MKLLIVAEKLRKGGKERRMIELIKGLSVFSKDIQVYVIIFPQELAYTELYELKIQIYEVSFSNNISLFEDYEKILKKIQPNIVQTWTLKTSFYFSFFKYRYKYKLVASYIADCFGYRGIGNLLQGNYVNLMADKVVGNSEAGMNSYKIPYKKREIIYNGFDINRIKTEIKNNLKQEFHISTQFVVIMVANVTKYKDYSTFLSVAREVRKRRIDISFLSVGGGKLLEEYKSKLKEEELEYIRFLGEINEVEDLINFSNIGLLCTYNEGISNAIIEYMMHKKPVIATGTGGTEEIINHNINGFLFKQGDVTSISNKIEELIDNKKYAEEISSRAYLHSVKNFSSKSSVKSYLKLYKSTIAS